MSTIINQPQPQQQYSYKPCFHICPVERGFDPAKQASPPDTYEKQVIAYLDHVKHLTWAPQRPRYPTTNYQYQ